MPPLLARLMILRVRMCVKGQPRCVIGWATCRDGEESTVKTGPHSLSAAIVFPDTQGHSHNMATTDCHLQASCLLSPIAKFMTKDTGNPKEKRERPPA